MPSTVHSAEARLSNIPLGLFVKSVLTLDAIEPHLSVITEVHDLENRERDVRLFFTQHLQINESTISDGVLFHPEAEALIHYKGSHAFLFASKGPSGKLDQFSCGGRHDGAEGSWKDAEDGHLNGKAISLGNVDSTYAIHFKLEPLGKRP